MPGPRQPIELVIAKGKKHLTKNEIEERRRSEVRGLTNGIAAPSFLTAKQKRQFDVIAGQLLEIGIMSSTDNDAIARYITAQGLYEQAVKDLAKVQKEKPHEADAGKLICWVNLLETLDKRVDRYYKQAQNAASALGLTISSRCKLVVPKSDEPPKGNKFDRFEGGKAASGK